MDTQLESLKNATALLPEIELAILVGSRINGTTKPDSDWDIAITFAPSLGGMQKLAREECVRLALAQQLGVSSEKIDLIDLPRANLAMRASVAEEGLVLKGEETLAWSRFLTRTWRELEDFYWERTHAA